jgi:hypothetical protein
MRKKTYLVMIFMLCLAIPGWVYCTTVIAWTLMLPSSVTLCVVFLVLCTVHTIRGCMLLLRFIRAFQQL